jgi:lipoate-protein ligase A
MDWHVKSKDWKESSPKIPAEAQDSWWVIWTGFQDGAWNMAVDEWLMATAADRPPTLRLYGWRRPTISLGRNERWRGAANLAALDQAGVRLVRRPTGGRAVLHHRELTYSVTGAQARNPRLGARLEETLELIGLALSAGLRHLGVDAVPEERHSPLGRREGPCFETATRFELRARGSKVVGSAQYRTSESFLQHGSIPAYPTLGALYRLAGKNAQREVKEGAPEQWRHLGADETARAIVLGFAETFSARVAQKGVRDLDLKAVSELVRRRYAHAVWTFRR